MLNVCVCVCARARAYLANTLRVRGTSFSPVSLCVVRQVVRVVCVVLFFVDLLVCALYAFVCFCMLCALCVHCVRCVRCVRRVRYVRLCVCTLVLYDTYPKNDARRFIYTLVFKICVLIRSILKHCFVLDLGLFAFEQTFVVWCCGPLCGVWCVWCVWCVVVWH